MKAKWFSTLLIVSMLAIALAPSSGSAGAAPLGDDDIPVMGANTDNPGHALADKQAALKEKALEAKLNGKANGKTHEVARGQYVELALEDTDRVFVVIAEFGNTRHVAFPDSSPLSTALVFDGPLHNAIPEPNRALDNSTLWQADYNKAHYEDMYFNRMVDYYQSQSSGRYTIEGSVTEWVKVPFNEARYGRSGDVNNIDPAVCASIVCNNTWFLIRDAMSFWVKAQLDAGWTMQQVTDYLITFDQWDRYDYDGDGNFDERDGYIDHFQIVHAGGDEAAGDPQQGTDAIWSHRWYAQLIPIGLTGPTVDGSVVPFGGFNAGSGGVSSGQTIPSNPTGVWVGDYTIQPENGGLGVFAHEYAHDLGLPDLYDTSGNTCGSTCENSTGFWTLMSSGSNIGDGGPNGIQDAPTDMGVWEKFQLGWLNYEVAFAGARSEHKLGPASTNTKQAQGLFVVLPDKEVVSSIGAPYAGSNFYYSGAGDELDHLMYRSFTLPAGASLSAQVRFDIELDWDYAYLIASTDGGATWTNVPTNLSTNFNPNGQNFGNGITGSTGGNWVALTADLSAYTGNVLLGFRYWTDVAVVEPGFQIDEISATGSPIDGAESDAGWTFDPVGGFRVSTGEEVQLYFNAYVAEFRQYRGYDTSLRTAYNFGFLNTLPDWVEFFPYQDGLLISYWDTSQPDNSTSAHPGQGLILPIDAHPTAMIRGDGGIWRSRMQTYDSTFTLSPTDAITLHWLGQASNHPSQPAVSVFNDAIQYWNPMTPAAGVMNPQTGTTIRIKSISAQGSFMQVAVNK
ncbi:MAG TPA: immune inhibitor A domain-containing protein [Anaerolineales bacterium]|nr:immune inhibitor A domain-containing protein [Anaerolineales bacterium]